MQTVLLIEDDTDTSRIVTRYLERSNFTVETAKDGTTGLTKALERPPDLIVLDWMLPGLDGLELLKRLRNEQRTPVIMLTARTEEADRILGLEFGADDYVLKPFSPGELVARVKAVLRRSSTTEDTPDALTVRDLHLDPGKRTVRLENSFLDLTTLEFDLLYTLMRSPGRVFTRDELLDRVWGADFAGVDRVVDVHISNLRQKLEADPNAPTLLLTVRGRGYKLAEDAP